MKARGAVLGCALLLGLPCGVQAQSDGATVPTLPAPAPGQRVAGRVVNAFTGQGIAGAKVEIRPTAGGPAAGSVTAGAEGQFAFAGVKPGGYSLQGEARGYTAGAYDAHGIYSTAIITGAGVDTESLVLRLTPEARISGRILDESGDGVRRASVELFREDRGSGVLRIVRWRTAQTDDLGTYEIARMPPGRYYVAATAVPWYAVHPQPAGSQNTFSNIGVVDAIDPGLDVAYPMFFYPGVVDSKAASALTVNGGEHLEVDLRLVPEPAVSIMIPHTPGSGNFSYQGLQTMLFGELQPVNAMMRGTPDGVTFEGVPAGQYVLRQVSSQPGGAARTFTVNTSGQAAVVAEDAAQALGRVVVRADSADGTPLPRQMQMALLSADARPVTGILFGGKTEGKAEGVAPGSYRLVRNGGMAGYFLARVLVDGKEVPGERIRVIAGLTTSVTVVVGTGTATLTGRALRDGKPAAGAMMLLVPADDTIADDPFWRDQSDLDGSFRLANVPPGNYLLVAIDDGWELEWKRPEVLAKYLPQGLAVVVPEGARARVKLNEVSVQPR